MRRDHLAFLLGGLAFGILIGFGFFKALATRPGGDAPEGASAPIPSVAGPTAPTQMGVGGDPPSGAPMVAEVNALKSRVESDPTDVEAWIRLGGIYQQGGMNEQAAEFYERAAALRPGDAALLNELGICYQASHKLEQALEAFQEAQKADPAGWEAVYNAVITLAALRRFDAARADLARLRQLKPDAPGLDQLEAAVRHVEEQAKAATTP